MYSIQEQKNALRQHLYKQNNDYFITFVFNTNISPESAQKRIDFWCQKINRKIAGPRWHKKDRSDLLQIFFNAEHINSNIHYHGLIKLPNNNTWSKWKLLWLMHTLWAKLSPAGNIDLKKILTQSDNIKFCDYSTKYLELNKNGDIEYYDFA